MGKYQRSDCAYSVSALVLDPCNFSSSEKEELCPALIATCWALLLLSITLCVSGWSNRLIDLVPGVGEQHATRPETKTKQLRSQRLEGLRSDTAAAACKCCSKAESLRVSSSSDTHAYVLLFFAQNTGVSKHTRRKCRLAADALVCMIPPRRPQS